jgi:hypothetical protein
MSQKINTEDTSIHFHNFSHPQQVHADLSLSPSRSAGAVESARGGDRPLSLSPGLSGRYCLYLAATGGPNYPTQWPSNRSPTHNLPPTRQTDTCVPEQVLAT